jgi:putative membrane protein
VYSRFFILSLSTACPAGLFSNRQLCVLFYSCSLYCSYTYYGFGAGQSAGNDERVAASFTNAFIFHTVMYGFIQTFYKLQPMERKDSHYKVALALVIAMHIAGLIGLQHPLSRPFFEQLIAFNLMVTAAIVFYFHSGFSYPFIVVAVVTFLAGYFVEVAGVHTGVIFGHYQYGRALGFKIWDVPVLIGLNWLVLVYCTGVITHRLQVPVIWKIIIGALLMVVLDFLIEPIAIKHDWWTWQANMVPLQNYAGWFVCALLLLTFFHKMPFAKQNRIAPTVYIVQFLFFLLQNILNNFGLYGF